MLVCAAAIAGLISSARAAEPIEGRWTWLGGTVLVTPTLPGEFHSVVVSGHVNNLTCGGPGAEMWPTVIGSGLLYTGTSNWFYVSPCSVLGPGEATFTLADTDHGTVCTAHPQNPLQRSCDPIVRPVQCNNGLDDDGDGDVDSDDPGCERPTDTTEAPDAVIDIADARALEGAGRVFVPITLSQPVGMPVTFTVTPAAGSATLSSDFYPPVPSRLTIPVGQTAAGTSVPLSFDSAVEADETFTLQLTALTGARPGRTTATVTIVNDDVARPVYVAPPRERAVPRHEREDRGGSDMAPPGAATCGLEPPTFDGDPDPGTDGRQRCPKPRPRAARVARGGSPGVDRLSGGGRGDVLLGLGGNDTLRGLAGGDRLGGGRGNDDLWGGGGNDELDGGDGDDHLHGGPGSDWLIERRYGDDVLDGGPGDDVIAGNHGHDTIRGGSGDDIISGGSGPDTVDCGPGYDTLYVNLNADRGRSRGCERIRFEQDIAQRTCASGGTGAGEQVRGSSGDDTCRAGGGDDVLEGAGGDDRLYGDAGNDELFGRKGADRLLGGAGNDLLEGGQGADRMTGGAGNDVLNGGYGRDRLSGGPGNDTLNAGWGERGEIVDCGPGRDTFIYGPGDRARNCEIVRKG